MRAMTFAGSERTVLSIDDIGAYDHVLQSACVRKLQDVLQLQGLLLCCAVDLRRSDFIRLGRQKM